MRWNRVARIVLAAAVVAGVRPVAAATVTFSGTVTYGGIYMADTLFAAAVDTTGESSVIGWTAVPAGTPPFTVPYAITFDNTGVTIPLVIGAILDVDDSGFDPDSLDGAQTNGDLLGWYAGAQDPVLVDPSTSHAGLSFAMPTGEIHGDVTFGTGQTWAEIEVFSLPNLWSPQLFTMTAEGTYDLVGLYPGDWIVRGGGPFGEICYGDPACVSPTTVTLTAGQVQNGIDLDFSVLAVTGRSWGAIKGLYR